MSSNHFYNYIVSEIPVVSVCGKTKQVDFEKQQKKTKFKINILRGKTTTTLLLYPDFPRLKFFKSPRVCPFSLRTNKQNKQPEICCAATRATRVEWAFTPGWHSKRFIKQKQKKSYKNSST